MVGSQGIIDAPFKVPIVDTNGYRYICLENGIEVICVSDPTTDKAAAATDVRVGSLSDPLDVPGLAHFTEHMLFYSSEKYPEEDEYSKFVSEHGGHTNAYTANESTNYHFDCNHDALEEALDRFAQFFVAPQISADGVDREANAVDSEHSKNINSDTWRKLQLWKCTANPEHPFSQFSTGNIDTLLTNLKARGEDPSARVRHFYQEHYAPNLMKVAVVGRNSLDELERMVRQCFSGVKPKEGIQKAQTGSDAVLPEQLGCLIKAVPVRDVHSLEIQWPTIPEQKHSRESPSHYVSHLLGHEGSGSAFALLKQMGWATGLVAGEAPTSYSERSFFMCRIDLTDEGNNHIQEVIAVIFKYLSLLRAENGVDEDIWNEMHSLSQLRFNYRDKPNPYDYVSLISHGMNIFELENLLESCYAVALKFDAEKIRQVVADLTPRNARIIWMSRELESECSLTETWYGTSYNTGPIPDEWMTLWEKCAFLDEDVSSLGFLSKDKLHLPGANEFIPSNLTLVDESMKHPEILSQTEYTSIWFRADASFNVPKALVYLHLHLPESYCSPTSAVLTQLFARLISDSLSEVAYPAEVAGLHYGCRSTVSGLLITLSGYNHRLPRLANLVLDVALSLVVDPERFEIVKEKLARDYANTMRYDQPFHICLYELAIAMEAKRWHVADYERVLGHLQPSDLVEFLPRLLGTFRIESYFAGNCSKEEVLNLVDGVTQRLQKAQNSRASFASQASEARVVAMQPGQSSSLHIKGPNPTDANSAMVVSFQIGPDSARTNALTELVAHIGQREAFHQLRTIEQLGYLTFFTSYWNLTVRCLAFVVQSSAKSAAYLESRVEAFILTLYKRLSEMTDDEFFTQVEELAKTKLEHPKRLREVASRDWREIDDSTHQFDRQEEEVKQLRLLKTSDLVSFFKENVLDKASRRKFCVRLESSMNKEDGSLPNAAEKEATSHENGHSDESVESSNENVEVIEDIYLWKRKQMLYPSLK